LPIASQKIAEPVHIFGFQAFNIAMQGYLSNNLLSGLPPNITTMSALQYL
jgi:hypothetical protein